MKGLILGLYDYFSKRRFVFWFVLCLSFILLAVLALRVSFEEDISKMLQMDAKTREYSKIIQNTRVIDKLVICISAKTSDSCPDEIKMAYCDSLVTHLKTIDSNLIKKITVSPDDFPFMEVYGVILRNLPFFIEEQDYPHLDTILQTENIQHRMKANIRLLSSPTGILIGKSIPWDPAGISNLVTLRLKTLGEATGYEIKNGHFFSKDKKNLVFFIEPTNAAHETGKNTILIKSIEGFIGELNKHKKFENVDCSFIGPTAIAVENARQIQRDTILTVLVMSLAFILLITSVFRKKRTPFLIFSPIIFGMLFALACISFIKPGISLIAIGATSVLLGIAVNYPIHILTHGLHERDLRKIIESMIEPMTIGSATTIGGFVCLLFVKADILHDFGLLGAFGLIGAVLFSLIFLPHLIGEKSLGGKPAGKWFEKVSHIQLDKSKSLRWGMIILTPVMLYYAQYIEFDSDLLHLNYMSPRLNKTEKILRGNDSLVHPLYVISYGKTFNQALVSAGRIKHLSDSLNHAGKVNKYTGIANFLPDEQEQGRRVARWKKYFTPDKIEAIRTTINEAGKNSGFKENAFNQFFSNLDPKAEKLDPADFNILFEAFAKEAVTRTSEMTTIVTVLKVPPSSGTVFYKLIEEQPDTRLLDNKFLSKKLGSIINDDFNFIAVFSALMVFLALLFTYGRVELAITAFVPMVVSWVWILGLMGLFHLKFNIVNIILSTFIFGLGDDYCIFMMDGLSQEFRNKRKQLPVIRMSIILSGITTIIGFGVMLIAKHPALQSIALVSVIGISSVLLISQVLEPYLFRMFVSSPVSRGLAPISFATFLKTLFVYTFFISGYIFLIITRFFIVLINPFYRKRSQKIFNAITGGFAWLQLQITFFVTKRVLFESKPDPSKSFIYLTNHQSFLEILTLYMLVPDLILIINKKGLLPLMIRIIAGPGHYYSFDAGIQPDVNSIKLKNADGYSIAAFPENARSDKDKTDSFSYAVFKLARQLEIDIIPVVFYSTGTSTINSSFVIQNSYFSAKFLYAIKSNETEISDSYQKGADSILEIMNQQYALLEEEARTPDLYRKRLIDNFIFKGPLLEWTLRANLRMERNYRLFNDLVPKEGVIIDAACGYGFLAYMLAYLSPRREVIGIDYDIEKIELAENGFDKPGNLRFIKGNNHEPDFPDADCIIFSDLIQYPDKQDYSRIFTNLAAKILKGGIIIIRTRDIYPGKRRFNIYLREIFSSGIKSSNKTKSEAPGFSSRELIVLFESLGFETTIIDQTMWASKTVIVFKKAI